MPEPRPASLLGFAIAASIAVVPVLLLVLLGMRSIAPVERNAGGSNHASVRQIAALKTFEHAIVRRDIVQTGPPNAQALAAHLPDCSAEWSGSGRAFDRFKEWVRHPREITRTPAHRIAAQLAVLDEALFDMSAAGNLRVADPVGFDVVRWAEAARLALATPVETPQYRGRRFVVRCADLASAVAMLSRARGRMLATLAWRGTAVQRVIDDWRPDQYVAISARQLARTNPWEGIAGCIYLLNGGAEAEQRVPVFFVKGSRSSHERVCKQPTMFGSVAGQTHAEPVAIAGEPGPDASGDDVRWHVPPSIHALLQPLDSLQRTSGSLYRTYTGFTSESAVANVRRPLNRVALDGAEVDAGFSVDLTIDPVLQALAQKSAACYTGRQDVCRALGLTRAEDGTNAVGHRLLEQAMVRMAAAAVVDVASGRIEALAGAMSPCTRQEYDGPGRATSCDTRLPYPIRYRPDALQNAAVFLDAMPASVVKPVMAAAFLSNALVGTRWLAAEKSAMRTSSPPSRDSLRAQLMRSSSARFLDRMFCGDEAFRPCERPWEIQAMASAFGWNGDCFAQSERCGSRDLLFGRSPGAGESAQPEPVAGWVPYGRLLAEPVAGKSGVAFRSRPPVALDVQKIKRCAAGADGRRMSDDDWEKCRGGTVVDVVAEGWGQGHARSTALGVAGMMAAIAAAANGQSEVTKPHLVRAVRGTSGFSSTMLQSDLKKWRARATETNALNRDAAEVILSGLSWSHRNGTARRACEQVFATRVCREIDWIAGKTGTPTFPNDDRSLDDLAKLCVPARERTRTEQVACGGLRPYKWYVAAYRTDPANPAWTKVIGVLVERNWLADSGRIHGAGDHGPNPAAELAMQIIGRHTGALARDWR
ncbi:MAG TPA: hypothetical protein VNG69_09100 [Casimicrobiaceae bacterium]|nr:hypothetical protein [Casimicrobiaceae bacterium]